VGDYADRHRDQGAREPYLERGRKIKNVECLNQAFRHATIPAHAALEANPGGHDLNRRVTSFGFNEKTPDFHIGKPWKFLSNPLAARDASGQCTTSNSIDGRGARDQKGAPLKHFHWLLAIGTSKSSVPSWPNSARHGRP
jgi:hypothetical protein